MKVVWEKNRIKRSKEASSWLQKEYEKTNGGKDLILSKKKEIKARESQKAHKLAESYR